MISALMTATISVEDDMKSLFEKSVGVIGAVVFAALVWSFIGWACKDTCKGDGSYVPPVRWDGDR